MLGIMSSSPWLHVKLTAKEPPAKAPCMAPATPPSLSISENLDEQRKGRKAAAMIKGLEWDREAKSAAAAAAAAAADVGGWGRVSRKRLED